jgi:hypothetical protein
MQVEKIEPEKINLPSAPCINANESTVNKEILVNDSVTP